MGLIIDSTLWVDYFRPKTPKGIKERVIAYVDDPQATLCDPVRFEILRAASATERKGIEELFATLPLEENPPDLWEKSIRLGQRCADSGVHTPALDLLLAQICLSRGHEIVSYDKHFQEIARVCPFGVVLLKRENGAKPG